MSRIEQRLQELGFSIPMAKPPVGNYLGCKASGDMLFAAARVSDLKGEVETEVSVEQARLAARDTVLLILGIVKQDIKDLDQITGVIKMTGFVRSSSNFTLQTIVLDSASDLLIQIFSDKGRHAITQANNQ